VVVDEKWLQDKKRVYPIVVDPTLTVQGATTTFDTFIANGAAYQSSNLGGEVFLITGTHPTYGVTRSLVKFQLSPLLSGAQIQSAKLNLNQYLTTTNTEAVDVYPITAAWTSSTATWSTPPTVGSKVSTTNVTAAGAYDFDLTSLAKDWYNGAKSNNGVMLRHAIESHDRKSYRSSDYATNPTQKPKLTITYMIEPLGVEDFWTTAASNVNTYNGNYYLEDSDISIDGRGPNLDLTRSYNSRANTSGIFGANWTSNIEQKITDSGNGPILYQDGDGTYHTFTPPASGTGVYDHPSGVYLDLYKNSDATYTIIDKDQTIYKFKSTGQLWQIVDSNANVWSIGSTNNLPTSITDASGRAVTLAYDANNHVQTVTDSANRIVVYGYDTSGNLQSVTHKDAVGSTLSVDQYGYDTAHQLTSTTDPNNNTETIGYTSNKVTSMSHPITVGGTVQTATTTIAYDTTNNITTVTDPKNHVTKYTNNDNGNVVKVVEDPSGLNYQTTYTYDDNNNLTDTKDANTNAASGSFTYHTTYDINGNVLTETNPLIETSETTYDANNNPITETDPNGNTSTSEYDDKSNETASTDAAAKSTATKYDNYGNVTEETSEMSPGNNLAINGSFEIDRNSDGWPDNWSKTPTGSTAISVDPTGLTTDGITIGKKSIKITNPTSTTAVNSDRIPYDPNKTYVFSGYVKTSAATGKAMIYVFGFNTTTGTYQPIASSYIKGTQDTTRLHVVIEPGDMPAGTNQLEIRGYTTAGSGTYWFDGLQVEEEFYGAYNTLENSNFERDTDPADSIPDRWFLQGTTADGDGIDTIEKHAGSNSVKLVGDPATFKTVYQDVQISGAAGAQFTISGFSKVTNPTAGKVYGYIINTYDSSNTLQEKFTYNFDSSKSHDWQHLAATIKTTKAFDHIRVYYEYSQQTGTAWFDTAKVILGSIRTQHTYDTNGNYETKTTDAIGNTVDKTYDSVGNTKTEKAGSSDTTQYTYDGLNYLTEVTDAKNNVTKYQYDNNGNKTKVTNAKLHDTIYEYNEIDKVKKTTDALNRITLFDFDLNGNLTLETKPDSHTIGHSYNAVDRQTAVKYDGTDRYTFQYDPNGNLTQETDKSNNQVTTFTYDADNKLKTKDEGNGNTVTFTYDKNGNAKQRKYIAGSTTLTHDNTFNTLDQLSQIQENTTTRATFTYDEADRVASRKNADGTVSLYKYDGAGNLIQLINYNSSGTILNSFSYFYDTKGRITSVTTNTGTTTYEYDELDQIKKETHEDGSIYDFTYDEVGNRLTKVLTPAGGTATTTTYHYDDANQISDVNGTNYTYDPNGNLTSDGNKTFEYDNANRLITVKDNTGNIIASFTYDSTGMRKTMTTSAGTITFHYDDNRNVIYETDGSNTIVASYTYKENQPISMTRGGTTYYYQLNGHGDVISLTNSSGSVVATYEYDVFGNIVKETGTINNPYRYAGYRYDKETGLYYLQSRYYKPDLGRFLTLDAYSGDADVPLTQNGYLYAENSPSMNSDPDGNFSIPSTTTAEKKLALRYPNYSIKAFRLGKQAERWQHKFYRGYRGKNDRADAFRHSYWNALMAKHMGRSWAKIFGNAHEAKRNPAIEKRMDFNNNAVGRSIGWRYRNVGDGKLAYIVRGYVKKHKMKEVVKGRLVST
jgi:RHS repeat-associated protein